VTAESGSEPPTERPAQDPGHRPGRPQGGQRRARRWNRNGIAAAFGPGAEGSRGGVGWTWEIKRDGPDLRRIDVEVDPGPYLVTDLPAEARNAIRSRGATAVDAFLEAEDPPVRIVVSTRGLQAYYAGPDES